MGYSSSYTNSGNQEVVVAKIDPTGSIPGIPNPVNDYTANVTSSSITLTVQDRTPQTTNLAGSISVNSWNPTVTDVLPNVVPVPEPAIIITALIISIIVLFVLKTEPH